MWYVVDVGSGTGVGSLGMTPVATSSGRVRACLEAVLVNRVMSTLQQRLTEAGLIHSFIDVEMPSLIILAKMELNGFGTKSSLPGTKKLCCITSWHCCCTVVLV